MRFREQVRWSLVSGGLLLVVAVVLIGGLFAIGETGQPTPAMLVVGFLAEATLFASLLLLIFGGVMRPLQKALYHWLFEPNDHYRERLSATPFLGWFWWIDSKGRDRDV
jgi:hypothetical protein